MAATVPTEVETGALNAYALSDTVVT